MWVGVGSCSEVQHQPIFGSSMDESYLSFVLFGTIAIVAIISRFRRRPKKLDPLTHLPVLMKRLQKKRNSDDA